MTGEGVVVTERLTRSYGSARGIVDVSMSVEPGEVFGFLGPNGAGKTTTIRTLLDFIRPTSGHATVLGMDTRRSSVEIHRRVGYLPGEFATYEHLTGREYLDYFAKLRGGVDQEFVDALADRLQSDLSVKIAALSHGNTQKVGLIQAFMHRPSLLILDEPTQGLDPIVQQRFHDMVLDARRAGQTVFLSSHDLPEVERVCDRVGIIRAGRLIAVEDVGSLTSRSVRTLEIRFAASVPADAFRDLPGVRDVEAHGNVVRCTVAGVMDPVIKAAARFDVIDLTSHEPSLEDIFLTFYQPGSEGERGHRADPVGGMDETEGIHVIITARTLREQRRALIGWSIGMAALVLLYASFYPNIRANADTLNDYIKSLPEALRNIVGRSDDIASPVGYLRSEIFSTIGPLLLLILAIGAGARATAGEEEDKTLDLLLANPVRRRTVVLQKCWAMVAATAGVGLVLAISILVFGPIFGLHVAVVNVAATVTSTVALAVTFGAIALAVGCWRGRRGIAIATATSLAVVAYLLNVLAPSVAGLDRFQVLSPFYHFIEYDPLRNGFNAFHLGVLVAIAAAALVIALVTFERRDLSS